MNARIARLVERTLASFSQLSRRERLMVAGMALSVAALAAGLIATSVGRSLDRYRTKIEEASGMLDRIRSLQDRYLEAKREVERRTGLVAQNKVNLLSSLGTMASQYGIEISSISQANPRKLPNTQFKEESVRVSLKRVDPRTLIEFLKVIEAPGNDLLYVTEITMKSRFDHRSQVNADLEVATLKANE